MRHLQLTMVVLLALLNSTALLADEIAVMTTDDLPGLGNPAADLRITYGDDEFQFVNLYLPQGDGPHPVMIFIHGGCWLSEFDITYTGKLAKALANDGIAVWNIEYRRVGNTGGGWPGTFNDIATAADLLYKVADKYSLDSSRVIASGHSAGGHLALWLGARHKFKKNSQFAMANPVQLQGILALAAAPDLAMLHEKNVCDGVIDKLMGGSPEAQAERYALGSASELVPLGTSQLLVIGDHDKNWRPVGERYYAAANAAGDDVEIIRAKESGHFEMIDPDSTSWKLVRDAAFKLLNIIPR
ncbi:MAG: alpha/beta fold hydrolase [Gammaproteobacteria bacterium]|nr:alpha/beta fold hydrolase [Gammaproteobacteria bacterium]